MFRVLLAVLFVVYVEAKSPFAEFKWTSDYNVRKVWKDEEETSAYWVNMAKEELDNAMKLENLNRKVAKNIILFVGDGMSIPTITAGRILKGQLEGESGVDASLEMDKLPHAGLSKTYAVDKQVADSASTATAMLCGVKATFFTLGLSAAARSNNCSSTKGNEVDSILVDAYKAGKSTGIVSTTRINHATPAGAYAHTPHRMWYDDAELSDEAVQNGCKDIAQQFYDSSHMITVALGGGRRHFQPHTMVDPEYPSRNHSRLDGQDLISQWSQLHQKKGLSAKYVWNYTEFSEVNPNTTDRLLGLFEPEEMHFETKRSQDKSGEPSLEEMTEKSLQILQKNSKGYFLLVEGGRIDHAHHFNNAYLALHDTLAFDKAIGKAVEMTSEDDTLIIVTADHSHTFSLGGFTDRGVSIFGLATINSEIVYGLDKKPFTSLLYGNGPGFFNSIHEMNPNKPRKNLTGVDTDSEKYMQQTAVPLLFETHGGDDVAIMARGPMAHLIHGIHQQSYIAYVMRYSSCLGNDKRHCENESKGRPQSIAALGMSLHPNAASSAITVLFVFVICLCLLFLLMFYVFYKVQNRKTSFFKVRKDLGLDGVKLTA